MKSKEQKRKEAVARMRQNVHEWEAFAKRKEICNATRYSEMMEIFTMYANGKTMQAFAQGKINELNTTIKNTEAK